jgi:hypothetical protein
MLAAVDTSPVYTFKIKLESNPALWLHLEMPAEAALHKLYLEAAACFGLSRSGEYSFYHDATENPFAEYASPVSGKTSKRRIKKTADVTLESMDLPQKRQLILTVRNQREMFKTTTVRLSIEMINAKPRETNKLYPAMTRISKKLREMSQAEET